MSYCCLPQQTNPLATEPKGAEVQKEHLFESGFKELNLENISLAKLLEGIHKIEMNE